MQSLQADYADLSGVPLSDFAEKPPAPSLAPASVEIHIHPPTVQLGQPFFFDVTLTHPAEFRFELLEPTHHLGFDIVSKIRSRPREDTTTFSIQMAAFELGTLELPPFQFEITAPGQTDVFELPAQTILVATSRAQASLELEDVRPPAPVFVPDYTVLYGGAAALAAALAFVLIWKWLRRRKKERALKVPVKPLAEKTREALDALRAQALPQKGKIREYYFMLSEIIRGYIGALHKLDALECTTTELIASLKRLPLTQIPIEAFAQFSHEADLIKYAKGSAGVAKCEADLKFAYRLIEQTAPMDEVSAAKSFHV